MLRRDGAGDPLFRSDVLELDGRIVIWTTTGRTQTIHRRLDIVVAKLTYLRTVLAQRLEAVHHDLEGSVLGSHKDKDGSFCLIGRTLQHREGNIRPRHHQRTGRIEGVT